MRALPPPLLPSPLATLRRGIAQAYDDQNFVGGRFNYYQVEDMRQHVQALGLRPMVVMPSKYMPSNFPMARVRRRARVAAAQLAVRECARRAPLCLTPAVRTRQAGGHWERAGRRAAPGPKMMAVFAAGGAA